MDPRRASSPEHVVGDETVAIADVVDRDALAELCRSVHDLFGLGVRIYAADGTLLASAATELPLCALVNQFAGGQRACGSTVSAARSVEPGREGEVTHPCFTGLAYHVVALEYETRRVGRIVIGPYAPAGLREPPASLTEAEPRIDLGRAAELLAKVPRVKPEALARIAHHLETTLELIVFSSHKARSLEQALARLKELDRLKSNFLATVSHELRTPLTSIIGYSEMLSEGIAGPLSEEQAEFVRTIHAKGEQLLALIMGLLDLSKLESGTMGLRQAPTRIEAVLGDVLSTLTPVARKKGVELTFEHDGASCELAADPERLRQVFVNLVDNAVKFTPEGGRVSMTSRVVDAPAEDDDDAGAVLLAPVRKSVEVRVADTGIGIPPAERARVFDAFYQVDSSSTREYGGTGLGLSIVKRIIEAHGGAVTIEGNEPRGAVFVVTLPSANARRLPSRVPPAPEPGAT